VLENGLVEIPMTLGQAGPLKVPFAGGVYFRALPNTLIRRRFKQAAAAGAPIIGYFHPYDIDTEQEHFMHPGINDSRFYNWLMYRNRRGVFPRLRHIMAQGFSIATHESYARKIKSPS
jgi:hypothetical protein